MSYPTSAHSFGTIGAAGTPRADGYDERTAVADLISEVKLVEADLVAARGASADVATRLGVIVTAAATDATTKANAAQAAAISAAGTSTVSRDAIMRLLAAVPSPTLAFPKTIAVPPVVADRADISDSTVTSPYLVPITGGGLSGPIQFCGPVTVVGTSASAASYTNFAGTTLTTATFYASDGGTGTGGAISGEIIWSFATDAPTFGVLCQGHVSSPWWVTVDGEPVSDTPLATPGNPWRFFRFGTRKMRNIRIRAASGFKLAGVVIGKIDSIAQSTTTRPLVAIMGDSYMNGSPELDIAPRSLKHYIGEMLGWDFRSSDIGSTGYAQVLAPGGNAFTDRVGNFSSMTLDGGLFFGGINDSTTGFQAAVATTLGTFRTAHPTTPMFVGAPWSPTSTQEASADHQTKKAALVAEAAVVGAYFIDNSGWVTGTGRAGVASPFVAANLVGDGNADIVIGDGTHPSRPNGTAYLASQVVASILRSLRSAL